MKAASLGLVSILLCLPPASATSICVAERAAHEAAIRSMYGTICPLHDTEEMKKSCRALEKETLGFLAKRRPYRMAEFGTKDGLAAAVASSRAMLTSYETGIGHEGRACGPEREPKGGLQALRCEESRAGIRFTLCLQEALTGGATSPNGFGLNNGIQQPAGNGAEQPGDGTSAVGNANRSGGTQAGSQRGEARLGNERVARLAVEDPSSRCYKKLFADVSAKFPDNPQNGTRRGYERELALKFIHLQMIENDSDCQSHKGPIELGTRRDYAQALEMWKRVSSQAEAVRTPAPSPQVGNRTSGDCREGKPWLPLGTCQ